MKYFHQAKDMYVVRLLAWVVGLAVYSVIVSYMDVVIVHSINGSNAMFLFWLIQGPAVWLIPTGGGFFKESAALDSTSEFIFFLALVSLVFAARFPKLPKWASKMLKVSLWLLSGAAAIVFMIGA